MSKEELMHLLNLSDQQVEQVDLSITDGRTEEPTGPASPTALVLDDWGLRQGEEVRENNALLLHVVDKIPELHNALADCFGAAFEPEPTLANRCTDAQRQAFFKNLLDTPEYHALHEQTQLDYAASELAALHFAGGLAELAKEKNGDPDLNAMKAVGKSLPGARKEVQDYKDACKACGLGEGNPGNRIDAKGPLSLFQRVRKNAGLRRIIELAGRYRRLAQSRQRQKTLHGQDDVVGVETGNNIGRLLPHELARLGDEDLELDALRRFAERQLMQREYRGTEPVARGPVVIVIDESGSMSGEPACNAKAFALAMAWVAQRQRRWCALVAFSGGREGRRLVLPPGTWDQAELLDWMEGFLGGGTTLDVPLVELPTVYWPEFIASGATRGKTDVICITDAQVDAPEDVVGQFNAWKVREHVRMISLIINGEPGDLAKVSDQLHRVNSISVDEEGIEGAVSI